AEEPVEPVGEPVEEPAAEVEDDLEGQDEQNDEAAECDEADEIVDEGDEVPADEQLTEEFDPVERPAAELAEDLDAEPRRRRGGYDPESDARLTEARFRFRQRVTLVLGVLAVVALGAGLM
ncbi:hypothetical protein KFZ73_26790, partial [Tsukamurella paurometabola]|nr:hypothetical protein [Tsukamurella paurometabola]